MANHVANLATRPENQLKKGKTASHGPSSARAAGLHYSDPDAPGLSRVRKGRGFVYRTAKGKLVRDARTLNRIHGLVLPPAWTDVWISPDPRGHLQATGRDAKGRKQYRYHPLWNAERDSNKYDRMLRVCRSAAGDPALRQARPDEPRVLAAARAGDGRSRCSSARTFASATKNTRAPIKSHGLTTLLDRHVKIRGKRLRFAFRGKSGVSQTVDLDDATLAKAVRECQDLPGTDALSISR